MRPPPDVSSAPKRPTGRESNRLSVSLSTVPASFLPRRAVKMSTSRSALSTDLEASTLRKLQARIIPFVFVLMVIALPDRINIGFAALTMNKNLAITGQQFGLLSGIFFWGYFIFEIPSNLLMHKVGARIWIARILISWGIVAMLEDVRVLVDCSGSRRSAL